MSARRAYQARPLSTEGFDRLVTNIHESLKGVQSTIKQREIGFLALLGAYPTATGRILEIGAFKGASTIVLSTAAHAVGDDYIWTADPFSNPCEGALPEGTSYPEFLNNLRRAGQEGFVKVFKGLSQNLVKQWHEPIRVLWIDGDHTYRGTKQDFELFGPFLAEGAIVAFHDVLTAPPGPCRVFANDVLLSREFGACGISGTIGWAQYIRAASVTDRHKTLKLRLYSSLSSHVCASVLGIRLPRLQRLQYLLLRNSHRRSPRPKEFLRLVCSDGPSI
jgi:predicted O-methyltransferase YrrM